MKTKTKSRAAPKRKPKKQPAKARAAKTRVALAKKHGPRADFGAPVDGFFAKQPASMRRVLDTLRKLIEQAAPDAEASLKWGMPFYTIGGVMFAALGGHKSHVNLILSGPPGTFEDRDKRLSGGGKTGRRLKLLAVDEVPTKAVRGWLGAAAELARKKA